MLFAKKNIGMEVTPAGVACALVGGREESPRLERLAFRPFNEGTMHVSLRDLNILEPQLFSERLREAHALLLHRSTRVSVSLPDGVGRILMLDVEGRFKNRSEGLDIIRWKLKKSMPFDVAETHLDYQVLRVRENGDMSLMVALVARPVIEQYEEAFMAAGLAPVGIDLHAFSLCRAFQRHLDLLENVAMVAFYAHTLGIVVLHDNVPEFLRFKDLAGSEVLDSRVFMEINNSILVWQERFPDRSLQKAVCIAAPDVASGFCDMVGEALGLEPALLEIKSAVTPSDDAPGDQQSLFPYSAAIGAAMRNL